VSSIQGIGQSNNVNALFLPQLGGAVNLNDPLPQNQLPFNFIGSPSNGVIQNIPAGAFGTPQPITANNSIGGVQFSEGLSGFGNAPQIFQPQGQVNDGGIQFGEEQAQTPDDAQIFQPSGNGINLDGGIQFGEQRVSGFEGPQLFQPTAEPFGGGIQFGELTPEGPKFGITLPVLPQPPPQINFPPQVPTFQVPNINVVPNGPPPVLQVPPFPNPLVAPSLNYPPDPKQQQNYAAFANAQRMAALAQQAPQPPSPLPPSLGLGVQGINPNQAAYSGAAGEIQELIGSTNVLADEGGQVANLIAQQAAMLAHQQQQNQALYGQANAGLGVQSNIYANNQAQYLNGLGTLQIPQIRKDQPTVVRPNNDPIPGGELLEDAPVSKSTNRTEQSGKSSTGKDLSKLPAYAQEGIKKYGDLIEKEAKANNVPVSLALALIEQESKFNPTAGSSAGAKGLMQLMPGTAAELGVKDSTNPEQNIKGGMKYIGDQLKNRKGDVRLALASYNAGPGAVNKHGGVPPFKETQNYVRIVIERQKLFQDAGFA